MPTDHPTATIGGHEFTIHSWPLEDLHRMASGGQIFLDPSIGLRHVNIGSIMAAASKQLIHQALRGRGPHLPITLNDRLPDTPPASTTEDPDAGPDGRYSLINGAHILAAAAEWFEDRVQAPQHWFRPGEVARTEMVPTEGGTEIPHTRHSWLTEDAHERLRASLVASVRVGAVPPADEQVIFFELNRQH